MTSLDQAWGTPCLPACPDNTPTSILVDVCHTLSAVFRAVTLSLPCGRELSFTTTSMSLNLQGLSFASAPFKALEGLANVFAWSYVAKFAKAIHLHCSWLIMLLLFLKLPLYHVTLQVGGRWRDLWNPVKRKVSEG